MLVKCPLCTGKGEYDVVNEQDNTTYPVKCYLCDGAGKVEKSVTQVYRKKRKS